MDKSRNGVIVIGGHVQGLGIVRAFGFENIPVILLDDTKTNIARFSKYCKYFIKYNKNELLETLITLGKEEKYRDWVLFPTNDYHVKILSINKDVLSKSFKVTTDNWEVISKCYNKINTYKIAQELDIQIPKTFFPASIEDLSHLDIEFPCIIKPAIMHEFYSKVKKKVFLCKSPDDLKKFYHVACEIIPKDQIIVQEIIKGPSENQYSACFLFQNGKSISRITACRRRQHPIDFGNATTFAELVSRPDLISIGEKILKHINYNGICEVEFKKNIEDGKYYFLEINPRTWKWHSISDIAGEQFLLNSYNILHGEKTIVNNSGWKEVAWRHIVTDIPVILKLKMKKLYHRSEIHTIKHAVLDYRDIKPFIFELILLPILIFKR